MWLKSTHDSESLQNILIQINSGLKKLYIILIQIDLWLKKLSGVFIRIKSWLNDSNQLLISVTFLGFHWISLSFLGVFTQFRWPFLGFSLKCCVCMTFLGHPTQVPWFESAHNSSSILKTWIGTTRDSSDFPGIDSESIHDSNGFPRYWFRLTHDSQSASPFFDSSQPMTQAKIIWFWVNSWFDSESYSCLLETRWIARSWAMLPFSFPKRKKNSPNEDRIEFEITPTDRV